MKSAKAVVKVMHPKMEAPSLAPEIREILEKLGEEQYATGTS